MMEGGSEEADEMRVVNDFETIQVRERPNRRYDDDSVSVGSHSTHYRRTHGLNQQPLPTEMFEIDSDVEDHNDQSVSSAELTVDNGDDDFLSAVRRRELELSPAESVEARSINMKSHLDEYTESSHRSRCETNITEAHFQVPEWQLEAPVVYVSSDDDNDNHGRSSEDDDDGEFRQKLQSLQDRENSRR